LFSSDSDAAMTSSTGGVGSVPVRSPLGLARCTRARARCFGCRAGPLAPDRIRSGTRHTRRGSNRASCRTGLCNQHNERAVLVGAGNRPARPARLHLPWPVLPVSRRSKSALAQRARTPQGSGRDRSGRSRNRSLNQRQKVWKQGKTPFARRRCFSLSSLPRPTARAD
jgi:hypothetical protein